MCPRETNFTVHHWSYPVATTSLLDWKGLTFNHHQEVWLPIAKQMIVVYLSDYSEFFLWWTQIWPLMENFGIHQCEGGSKNFKASSSEIGIQSPSGCYCWIYPFQYWVQTGVFAIRSELAIDGFWTTKYSYCQPRRHRQPTSGEIHHMQQDHITLHKQTCPAYWSRPVQHLSRPLSVLSSSQARTRLATHMSLQRMAPG